MNASALAGDRPVLVVLPGSRESEVKRLMAPFGDALHQLQREAGIFEVILPVVGSVRHLIEARQATWPLRPAPG